MTQYEGLDEFPIDLVLPDDGVPPTAAQQNPMLEGLADRTKYLFNRIAGFGAMNWHPPLVPVTITFTPAAGSAPIVPSGARDAWQAIAWSTERQQWVVATSTATGSGVCEVFASSGVYGPGEALFIVDAAIGTSDQLELQKLISSPVAANRLVAFTEQFAGGNYKINVFTQDVAGAWTLRAVIGSNTAARKRADGMYTPLFGFVAGVGVNAGQSSVELHTSTNGVGWTTRTASLPGGITANCPSWAFAASASRVLAIPRGAAQDAYVYSSDGVTWTAGSLGILSGTELATAIAYGPAGAIGGSVFIVSIVDGATGNTRFVRSADGITWTAVAATISVVAVSDIAVLGAAFVAVSEQADRSGTILYSVDGGLKWRRTRYGLVDNFVVGTDRYMRARIVASDNGLLVANSKLLRFSLESGLTAQLT